MSAGFLAILLTDQLDHGVTDVVTEIPIDLCTHRGPTYDATVTAFPVESGSTITDHRRREPDGYEIEGVVSATPLNQLAAPSSDLRGDSTVVAPASAPSPLQTAHDALVDLHENGRLVTIIDQYKQYENMVLDHLEMPRDKDTGGALVFRAHFKKITIVQTASVPLPASVIKKLKARPKISKDAQLQRMRNQLAKQVKLGQVSGDQAQANLNAYAFVTTGKVPGF